MLSGGGGIFSRAAKSIPLSLEMRQVLDIEAETVMPNELIRALLRRPSTSCGTEASAPM